MAFYNNNVPVSNYYPQQVVNNPYQYQPQPVTPQFSLPQQMSQVPQPAMMVGRIVNDISDIRPNETPTTGQPAVFPKADGSVIYLTCMDQTGRIITREYVPKEEPKEQPSSNDTIASLQEQLNRIEKMLSDLT